MSVSGELDFDVENLPVDVFDVSGLGVAIESLTGGHGMTEIGASCGGFPKCSSCLCISFTE